MDPNLFLDMMKKPRMSPVQALAQQAAPQTGGFSAFMARPGLRDALLQTGLGMMAQRDQPGSFIGALGRAAPAGVQAYQGGQSNAALAAALQGAPGSMQKLMQIDPRLYMQVQAMQPEKKDPYMAVGGNVFNRQTGTFMQPEPDAGDRYRTYANGATYDTQENKWVVEPPPPRPMVEIRNTDEATLQGVQRQNYETVMEDALRAEDQIGSLDAMERLLDSGAATGGWEEMSMPVRQAATDIFGLDPEKLARQETFQAFANRLALEAKGNMTGQMSDRDIIFLQRQVPSLANTPEGNQLLIDVMRRLAKRKIELADLADEYYAENGSLTGWRKHRSDWVKANPVFGDFLDPRSR